MRMADSSDPISPDGVVIPGDLPQSTDTAPELHGLQTFVADALKNIPARPDPHWRGLMELVADLATANTQVGTYITRTLAADSQQGDPVSVRDESTLGTTLVDLGKRLKNRAQHRLSGC